MADDRHAGGDPTLPDDFELVAGRSFDARPTGVVADPPGALERMASAPPRIRPILDRLGIKRSDRWVWITTADRLFYPELPRFNVNDGGEQRQVPLHPEDAERFDEFTLEVLGLRLDEGAPIYGRLWFFEDRPTDIRYIRVRWHRPVRYPDGHVIHRPSLVYAEYVVTRSGGADASIHGLHHHYPGQERKQDLRDDIEHALDGLGLFFKLSKAGGRPKGPTPPDPTFADRFYKALRTRYADGYRDRPSQAEVADHMGESVDTLQRRIQDVPLPWPPTWPPE